MRTTKSAISYPPLDSARSMAHLWRRSVFAAQTSIRCHCYKCPPSSHLENSVLSCRSQSGMSTWICNTQQRPAGALLQHEEHPRSLWPRTQVGCMREDHHELLTPIYHKAGGRRSYVASREEHQASPDMHCKFFWISRACASTVMSGRCSPRNAERSNCAHPKPRAPSDPSDPATSPEENGTGDRLQRLHELLLSSARTRTLTHGAARPDEPPFRSRHGADATRRLARPIVAARTVGLTCIEKTGGIKSAWSHITPQPSCQPVETFSLQLVRLLLIVG